MRSKALDYCGSTNSLQAEKGVIHQMKQRLNLIGVLNSTIRTLKNIVILNMIRTGKVKVPDNYPKLLLELNNTDREIRMFN